MDLPLASELDTSFEPLQRARSNTWPLPRPENFDESSMSPSMTHHTGTGCVTGSGTVSVAEMLAAGDLNGDGGSGLTLDSKHGSGIIPELITAGGGNAAVSSSTFSANHLKKGSSRRNAWGNLSYADLITQAITSSPESRLTLSQIYEWMVQNVPYFKDKGDNNSSAGWKNSIRHNLSLHNRFMRVQNEGTGKSSWWMLNPDAKPGKSTRRRATSMETSKFEKRRGRVKKKVEALRNGVAIETNISPSSSISETVDLFPDFPESPLLSGGYQPSPDFRTRASSNASSCSRLSPIPAVETEWTLNYNYVPPPDQLAGSLEQHMKITGNGHSGSDSYLYSTYQTPQQPLYSRADFSRIANSNGTNVPATSSSQNCLIHQMQPCNCGIFLSDLKQGMSPLIRSSNSSPGVHYLGAGLDHNLSLLDDLNINIETIPGDFECNVDEVIRHELSIGGSLDFNFGAANGGDATTATATEGVSSTSINVPNLQTPSSVAATAAATAVAAAAAAAANTKNNCGQPPTFRDNSWVH